MERKEKLEKLEGLILGTVKPYDDTVKELENYFLKSDLCICNPKAIINNLKAYYENQGKEELEKLR